jgi:hypothetical protein
MFEEIYEVHTMQISPTSGAPGGWEYTCAECSYHARYLLANGQNAPQLQVLDCGDHQARHISHDPLDSQSTTISTQATSTHDDEAWLTPEIRAKIEKILAGLD